MSNFRPSIQSLRPIDLNVDIRVQRALKESRVNHLVANWDEEKLGIIEVSRREDGDYVTDGWHRVQALLRMGRGNEKFSMLVVNSRGLAHEAKRFVARNGETRRPQPIDLFRINLVAGEPEAIAINLVLSEFSLEVRNASAEPGVVTAVSALQGVYRRGGETLLRDVLWVMHNAWRNEPGSYPAGVIAALGVLLGNEDMDIDHRTLARKLAEDGTSSRLVGKGRTLASVKSKSVTSATAEVIVDIYNKGRSTTRIRVDSL